MCLSVSTEQNPSVLHSNPSSGTYPQTQLKPTVLIDFELGIKNSLEVVFPAVIVIKGCYVHFTQKYMAKNSSQWITRLVPARPWVRP